MLPRHSFIHFPSQPNSTPPHRPRTFPSSCPSSVLCHFKWTLMALFPQLPRSPSFRSRNLKTEFCETVTLSYWMRRSLIVIFRWIPNCNWLQIVAVLDIRGVWGFRLDCTSTAHTVLNERKSIKVPVAFIEILLTIFTLIPFLWFRSGAAAIAKLFLCVLYRKWHPRRVVVTNRRVVQLLAWQTGRSCGCGGRSIACNTTTTATCDSISTTPTTLSISGTECFRVCFYTFSNHLLK